MQHKLWESLHHAPERSAEMFIVEGDSAAEAVVAVRNPLLQAVFALQGKPLNALKAPPARLLASPGLSALTSALGNAPGTALPFGGLRFDRIVLLMDPDADGIHAGALLQLFLLKCMPSLLEQGHVAIVHAPWGEIRRPGQPPLLSFHAAEYQEQARACSNVPGVEKIRYRGLGTITPSILDECCVNPATRREHVLTLRDAQLAARVFGGAGS